MNASQVPGTTSKVFVSFDQKALKAEHTHTHTHTHTHKKKPTLVKQTEVLPQGWGQKTKTKTKTKTKCGPTKRMAILPSAKMDRTNVPTVIRRATGKKSAPNCQMIPN